MFMLKTGFRNNKLLFWTKIFNVFDPIQHDLTSPNFITLLNSLGYVGALLKFLIFYTLEETLFAPL